MRLEVLFHFYVRNSFGKVCTLSFVQQTSVHCVVVSKKDRTFFFRIPRNTKQCQNSLVCSEKIIKCKIKKKYEVGSVISFLCQKSFWQCVYSVICLVQTSVHRVVVSKKDRTFPPSFPCLYNFYFFRIIIVVSQIRISKDSSFILKSVLSCHTFVHKGCER